MFKVNWISIGVAVFFLILSMLSAYFHGESVSDESGRIMGFCAVCSAVVCFALSIKYEGKKDK